MENITKTYSRIEMLISIVWNVSAELTHANLLSYKELCKNHPQIRGYPTSFWGVVEHTFKLRHNMCKNKKM